MRRPHWLPSGATQSLTLDAVGAATGVSKGGVLYHFPTKEALVAALVEQLSSRVRRRPDARPRR